jgi:hypothetical protein
MFNEKIFVTVGPGRAVPLPIPGGGSVPGLGGYVSRTLEVERLIEIGDLVVGEPPAPVADAPVADAPVAEAPAAGDAAEAKTPRTAKGT